MSQGKYGDLRARTLDLLSTAVGEAGMPVTLGIPPRADFLAYTRRTGQPLPRKGLDELWPTEVELSTDLLAYLIENDLYSTAGIRSTAPTVVSRGIAESRRRRTSPERNARVIIVEAMGDLLVRRTDHPAVSKVEVVVSSSYPPDHELTGMLAEAKGRYLNTVSDAYNGAHTTLGDLPSQASGYEDYARQAASLARTIALNQFGFDTQADQLQELQFRLLANYYTRPA